MNGALHGWPWNGGHAASPDDLGIPRELDASAILLERSIIRGLGAAIAVREVGGPSLTYQQLDEVVTALAARLPWHRGSRVVIHLGHSVEFLVCFLALLRAGCVAVPVPATARIGEAVEIVDDAAPAAVLSHHVQHFGRQLARQGTELIGIGNMGSLDARLGSLLGRESLRTKVAGSRERTDEAYWFYTSGTSGRPKAARHRHQDFPAGAIMWADNVLGLEPGQRCASFSPMTHSYGLLAGCLYPLWAGGEVVVLTMTHYGAIWRAICTERIERLFGTPRHFACLLDFMAPASDGHRLRVAHCSGEHLPHELQRRFEERAGIALLDAMGSSELFSNPISNTEAAARPHSCGRAIPGIAARLVAEGRVVTGAGSGELEIASAANAFGYWDRPAATSSTFQDGYCRTGDLFDRDADGFFYYRGRLSSRFKVFGEFVEPHRLESAARTCPLVTDAVAFEVQARHGVAECGMAMVVTAEADPVAAAREVRAACADAIGSHAVPATIYSVGSLPTTHSGKINRAAAREFAEANGQPC